MNSELSLTLLRAILPDPPWTEDHLRRTVDDLRVLAEHKYNKYEMYQPGRLFFENLFLFLSRLEAQDATTVLEFLRRHLLFVSREEFQQLAHVLHYDHIRQRHLDMVAALTATPRHRLAQLTKSTALGRLQRASLYVALSDGARIDYFRRHNLDIGNEQVLASYDVGPTKLDDVHSRLQRDLDDPEAKFGCLLLLDDFCGSGRTLLREVITADVGRGVGRIVVPRELLGKLAYDEAHGRLTWQYRGRITEQEVACLEALSQVAAYRTAVSEIVAKGLSGTTELKGAFAKIARTKLVNLIGDTARVFFAPLLITRYAYDRLERLTGRLPAPLNRLELLPAATIPDSARINKDSPAMGNICERYYTPLEDEHTGNVTFGYDGCGLPLVLHHNTPNNSIYWLWSRKWTDPLFVRYERHGREVTS